MRRKTKRKRKEKRTGERNECSCEHHVIVTGANVASKENGDDDEEKTSDGKWDI